MGNGFGTHDPFSSFFGDFFGGGTHEHDAEETPKGADVVIDLYVTLEVFRSTEISNKLFCCSGTGDIQWKICRS
jgi:DnaJ-class molecular chaperone